MAGKTRKPPIDPVRWTPPPIEQLPHFPAADLTVVPMPGDGPEDVVVDADGNLWTGLVDGRIVRVAPDGAPAVVADTGGRPLGLHVTHDGRLLICDSLRGLLALDIATGRLRTLVTEVAGRPLTFCSNVTETADGTIYFTESTSRFHFHHYQAAIIEARGAGGLYRLDPDGSVHTVADGLYFANGVTVTADGSAVVFAETQARRLSKYWLAGPAQGTISDLTVNLPGLPDNICTGPDGRIWVAMVSPIVTAAEFLAPRAPLLRKLLWRLPSRLLPTISPMVWAVAFDPDSGAALAGIEDHRDDFGAVTGVVVAGDRLWLSSLEFPALAHCLLPV